MPPGTRRPAPSNKTKRSYGYRLHWDDFLAKELRIVRIARRE